MYSMTIKMRTRCAGLGLLALLTACGGEPTGAPRATEISPEDMQLQYARFSPDGSRVAYWQAASGGWLLAVAATDFTSQTLVDSMPAPVVGTEPNWSPDGTSLAYMSGRDLNIWVASLAGGPPRQLTMSGGLENPVQWHPRGDRLSYVATFGGGEIHPGQIDIATGTASPIVTDTRPAVAYWSPDGSKIAYNVFGAEHGTIWVADSTGHDGRPLTTEGFEQFNSEAVDPWSPDGSALLYESRRTGTTDVWLLQVDGDSARQLTRDVRDDYAARWSPDGKWVAFLSNRGQQTDIWIVPDSGGSPIRVTDDVAAESDVQWVSGTNEVGFSTGVESRGLWTKSLVDGAERRLTPDSIRVGTYDLSPDGRNIVYQVVRGGGVSDLEIVATSGGGPRILVAGSVQDSLPVWSPDGTKVLFISNRSGNRDVWVVDAAGGEPRNLTNWPSDESTAAWSADGSSVYFLSDHDASPLRDLWTVTVNGGAPRRVTQVGTVADVVTSRISPDVFVGTFGGSEGQLVFNRLLPDGRLQVLWDRSNALGLLRGGIMPPGDSLALLVQSPNGGFGTMLLPARGGEGRPMLGTNEFVTDWSPDGQQVLYVGGLPPHGDIYVMSLGDGAVRRVTDSPDDESRAYWLPGGTAVLFDRSLERRRVAVVDVSGLIGRND